MNKHENIRQWLSQYPQILAWLYFNTINDIDGQIEIDTIDGEEIVEEYISGVKLMSYKFSIIMIKGYDTGTSTVNTDAIQECENFIVWLEEQKAIKNCPEMGGTIDEINLLQSTPTLAFVNQDNQTAKYTFAVEIKYAKGE